MKKHLKNMTLFQKFAATIILLGLIPMLILSVFISNKMIRDYQNALKIQYEQAVFYVGNSIDMMINSYNTISKMPYNYNYGNESVIGGYRDYDNLRQIIHGDHYGEQNLDAKRKREMENFLKYAEGADAYLCAAHFVGVDAQGNPVNFHYSSNAGYFKSEELFEREVGYGSLDRSSNKLMIIPKHSAFYFTGMNGPVFTVARNYFDIRSEVGNSVYVGTLYLDIRMERLEQVFRSVKFSGAEKIYIVNDAGKCVYNSIDEETGMDVKEELGKADDAQGNMVLAVDTDKYGLRVAVIVDTEVAFSNLRTLQRLMYLVLAASMLALVVSSVLFSRRLVKPIHAMMGQMEQVENGNFDIQLPIQSADEIGILSDRFNQMSRALKNYINKYYVAQIRQKEAELTALKSQIYPHFLYNTLEIIRMTAVENYDNKVSEMIEALSAQIHYLIGSAQDMVPLEKEMEIIKKYVYLLNCRISGKVQLIVSGNRAESVMVPKLILQPIVENAYIHGIKPKNGNGSISVETQIEGDDVEISVMDNGIGMDQGALDKIRELLQGDDPGIKNEYNWQSIGMKNIHDRLKYLYGDQYGIQVTSTQYVGTIVCVRMPVLRGEQNERKGKDDHS